MAPKEQVSLIRPFDFAPCGFQEIEYDTKTKKKTVFTCAHMYVLVCVLDVFNNVQIHTPLSTKGIGFFKVPETRTAHIDLNRCGKLLANVISTPHNILAVHRSIRVLQN